MNWNGVGERLFDAEGARTQYLQTVLNFLQAYQAQFEATRAFCRRLLDLDLLEPMQARFTLRGGQRLSLGGFKAVNRDRLKALSGDNLSRVAVSGDLDLIYAHLHSQRNFTPDRGAPVARGKAGSRKPRGGERERELDTAPVG